MHARFSAKSRTYKYYVSTKKSPFDDEFSARITFALVRQNNYAVLMLVQDNLWNPVEGSTLKLYGQYIYRRLV